MSQDFKHELANRYKTPIIDQQSFEYVLREDPAETFPSRGLYYLSPVFEGVGTATWHLDCNQGYVDFHHDAVIELNESRMSKMRPIGKLPASLLPEFYEARLVADLNRVKPRGY